MTIVNSAAVLEDHFPKIKKATVVIEYGKPIYIDTLSKEEKKSIGSMVQGLIEDIYFKNKAIYFPENVEAGKSNDDENTVVKDTGEN